VCGIGFQLQAVILSVHQRIEGLEFQLDEIGCGMKTGVWLHLGVGCKLRCSMCTSEFQLDKGGHGKKKTGEWWPRVLTASCYAQCFSLTRTAGA
jgi:hypothetical protein